MYSIPILIRDSQYQYQKIYYCSFIKRWTLKNATSEHGYVDFKTNKSIIIHYKQKTYVLVAGAGFEPATFGL